MTESKGQLIDIFTGNQLTDESRSHSYAHAMTRLIVPGLGDLGLDPEYMAILSHHVDDLHVVINSGDDTRASRLGVVRVNDTDNFIRIAAINERDIKTHASALETACGAVLDKKIGQEPLQRLALDWLFFELSADALANSYDMQRRVGKYVPDLDGQSAYYESQYSISESFLDEYAQAGYTKGDVVFDHVSFKRGVALHFLQESLLSIGVAQSQSSAKRLTNYLAKTYPQMVFGIKAEHAEISPMRTEDLYERFLFMQPNNTRSELASFVLANYGPEREPGVDYTDPHGIKL